MIYDVKSLLKWIKTDSRGKVAEDKPLCSRRFYDFFLLVHVTFLYHINILKCLISYIKATFFQHELSARHQSHSSLPHEEN